MNLKGYLVAAFAVLAMMLVGCSNDPASGLVGNNEGENKNVKMEGLGQDTTVSVLSFRFPATEHYTSQMESLNVENLKVNAEMKGYDQYRQQYLLMMSGKSNSPYQIFYANNELFDQAKTNEWLLPLDDLLDKYWDKYNLDDIPEETWDRVKYNGKIYGIPFQQNLQHTFYRKDIFKKYDLDPPKTYEDMLKIAETLKKEGEFENPIAMNFGKPNGLFAEFHNALMAYNGKWFDEENQPLFNSEEGIQAVKTLKELLEYMPSGALTFTNDDVMVALQQKQTAMTSIWTSRATTMDDPVTSQVAGKVAYAPAVSSVEGGIPASQFAQDAFVIPKNSDVDPDTVVQVILEAIDKESMKQSADLALPVRESIISDKEIIEEAKQIPAAQATVEAGAKPLPDKKFMNLVTEKVGYYVAEALTDNMSPKEALDQAAKEVEAELKSQGYIK